MTDHPADREQPAADDDDVFARIVDTFEEAGSPLLCAVLEAARALVTPDGPPVTMDAIGLRAWSTLPVPRQLEAIPELLAVYAARIMDEERERAHQELANRADVDTCLTEYDESSAWDSVADRSSSAPGPDETVVDRQTLINLLSEVDLLRRRSTPTDAAS